MSIRSLFFITSYCVVTLAFVGLAFFWNASADPCLHRGAICLMGLPPVEIASPLSLCKSATISFEKLRRALQVRSVS